MGAALSTAAGSLFAAGDAALSEIPEGRMQALSADVTGAGAAFRRFTADPLRILSRWLVGRVVALSVATVLLDDAAHDVGLDRLALPVAVLGAVLQLGRCFDLLNEAITAILAESHRGLVQEYLAQGTSLPENHGPDRKRRDLDCLVINECLDRLRQRGIEYDTVRGAFLEGDPVYPGAGFSRETHLQVAMRDPSCILGVFRPNLP